MNPLDFIAETFALYAVTLILASSHVAKPLRRGFRHLAWAVIPPRFHRKFLKIEKLPSGTEVPVLEDDEDLDLRQERDIEGYDYISCRMCTGVMLAVVFFWWFTPFLYLVAIYGASYFLHTQERE